MGGNFMSEPQTQSQQKNSSAADGTSAGAATDTGDTSSGVGALLHASRLRIGEELREVADVLRIRYRYLEDIEASRFDALPGATYAIGFIRTYADHLGLDGEEVVRRFKEEIATSSGEENFEFPAPIGEAGIPAGAVIFVGLVIAVLTYGVWYASTTEKGFIAELISPLPDRLAKILPEEEKKSGKAATMPEDKSEPKVDSTSEPVATDQSLETVVSGLPATTQKTTKETKVEREQTPGMPLTSDMAPDAASNAASGAMNKPSSPDASKKMKSVMTESASVSTQAAPVKLPETKIKEKEIKKVEPVKAVKKELEKKKPEQKIVEKTPAVVLPVAAPVVAPVAAPKIAPKKPTKPVAAVPTPETSIASAGGATAGRVYGTENSDVRIVVRAKKNSWIQVRDDVANKLLLTRLLRSGDSYRVPNRAGLKLLAGNAGALEILVDGKSVPSIGPQGAVRRSVALDAARLLEGKAVIE
jgi:cytoskeleton protein RodZ